MVPGLSLILLPDLLVSQLIIEFRIVSSRSGLSDTRRGCKRDRGNLTPH